MKQKVADYLKKKKKKGQEEEEELEEMGLAELVTETRVKKNDMLRVNSKVACCLHLYALSIIYCYYYHHHHQYTFF